MCMPSRNALLFSRRPDTAKAWDIAPQQFPRDCGGAACNGNECGPQCGIREPGDHGKLGVSLPGWFYQNGFFTSGAGKHVLYTLTAISRNLTFTFLIGLGRKDFS